MCPDELLEEKETRSVQNGLRCIEFITTITTQVVASMKFENLPPDPDRDDYLSRNSCTPKFKDQNADFHDVGFALYTDDPWYGGRRPFMYRDPVPDHLAAHVPWLRDLGDEIPQLLVEPGSVIVEERNSSRLATPEELPKQENADESKLRKKIDVFICTPYKKEVLLNECIDVFSGVQSP